MKKILNASVLNDSIVGIRVAVSYSVIDDTTGKVITSNERIDYPVTEQDESIVTAFLESVNAHVNK